MTWHHPVLGVGETSSPWTQHNSSSQASHASSQVHNTAASHVIWRSLPPSNQKKYYIKQLLPLSACKIHVAHVQHAGNPTSTPSPGHDHGVNEAGHEKGEDRVGRTLHPLSHRTAHNGGTRGAEGLVSGKRLEGEQTRLYIYIYLSIYYLFKQIHRFVRSLCITPV